MAENVFEFNAGNTNIIDLLNEWTLGEDFDEQIFCVLPSYIDAFSGWIDDICEKAQISGMKFDYSDGTIQNMHKALDSYPCTMNVCLNGEEGKTKYVIDISLELDEQCNAVSYSVYLSRIHEDETVETFDTVNKIWETVDPELIQFLVSISDDQITYRFIDALEILTGKPVIFFSTEEVKSIIADNKKLIDLYRAVAPISGIIADDQLTDGILECLVPLNPDRQAMTVIQAGEKLVLGLVMNIWEGGPSLIAIYDTCFADEMAEALKIIWNPDNKDSETYPKLRSGNIMSAKRAEK